MTDSIALANLAITVLSRATEALTGLRERAQRSKDVDIRDQINTLFDNVLQLKDVVSRLLDENKELKRQLEQQQLARIAVPTIKQAVIPTTTTKVMKARSVNLVMLAKASWSPFYHLRIGTVEFAESALFAVSTSAKRE